MPVIRPCCVADLPTVTAIYAHHVRHSTGTFEIDPPSPADMVARYAEVQARGLPWLVAEQAGSVLGYAYCNWFRPRAAFRFAAEDSIYLAPTAQRQGLGRALLAELALQAERAGVRRLIAVIGDSGNAGSIGLHQALGFTQTGLLTACGWKFDRWLDVVLMDCPLGAGNHSAPISP